MMNKRLNMPQLQHIMRDFEKQNQKMEVSGRAAIRNLDCFADDH